MKTLLTVILASLFVQAHSPLPTIPSGGKSGRQAKPQADDAILGLWFNQEKTSKIEIFKMKEMYYGKLSWLKVTHEDGKPRVDKLNPDESKRTVPLMGLLVLRRFKGDGSGYFSGGTIYDPKNGKEYSCKMTLKGKTLDVRGYVGLSLLGRTAVWTRE